MNINDTVLVLIDVQEKLASVMHDRESLLDNLRRLLLGMYALEVPILWMEQVPEKMGPTVPELARLLKDGKAKPIAKASFACGAERTAMLKLSQSRRHHMVLAGIESHVCVYQTARDLVSKGYAVEVVTDATSSRTPENKAIGLKRCEAVGAQLTSVETLLFELLGTSSHPAFKKILDIVK
jgi:nicotinamidase-related amidase